MKIEKYTAQITTGNNTITNILTLPVDAYGVYYIEYVISVITDDLNDTTVFKYNIALYSNSSSQNIIYDVRQFTPPTSLGTSLTSAITNSLSGTDFLVDVTGLAGTGSTDNLNWSIVADVIYTSV